jgi:hypothetical protein
MRIILKIIAIIFALSTLATVSMAFALLAPRRKGCQVPFFSRYPSFRRRLFRLEISTVQHLSQFVIRRVASVVKGQDSKMVNMSENYEKMSRGGDFFSLPASWRGGSAALRFTDLVDPHCIAGRGSFCATRPIIRAMDRRGKGT